MKNLILIILLGFSTLSFSQYILDTNDYQDELTEEQVQNLWETAEVSLIEIKDTSYFIYTTERFFYIVVDRTYYENGIHLWEYRKLILTDILKK